MDKAIFLKELTDFLNGYGYADFIVVMGKPLPDGRDDIKLIGSPYDVKKPLGKRLDATFKGIAMFMADDAIDANATFFDENYQQPGKS